MKDSQGFIFHLMGSFVFLCTPLKMVRTQTADLVVRTMEKNCSKEAHFIGFFEKKNTEPN